MNKDLYGPDGHADERRDSGRAETNGSLSDREVPLNPRRTPAVVQAWLDGEVSVADAARGGSPKDVEFWNRINEQAEERRHLRTPVHVQQRIMEAIPKSAPAAESGWFHKEINVTNGKLLLIGAAMVAVGMLAAMLIIR